MIERDLKLRIFREHAKLDNVVKRARNNLEKLLLLNDWSHHQIPQYCYGQPKIEIYDPLYQLAAINNRIIDGWCGNYAILLVNACLSMDFQARYVTIWKENSPNFNTHSIVEAFRPIKRKWMCLDPYFNLHLLDKDGPLSVEEISSFVQNNNFDAVDIENPTFTHYLNSSTFKIDYLTYYYGYKIGNDTLEEES